jgi:hypothetical protein
MAGLPVHPLSPLNDKDKPDTKHKSIKTNCEQTSLRIR